MIPTRNDPSIRSRAAYRLFAAQSQLPDEAERLTLLSSCFDASTRAFLESIPIRSGWTALEIGAGNGSIARLLGDLVGEQGRVVATDTNRRLLSMNDASHEPVNVSFIHHDISRDPLPRHAFDVVHVRGLLYLLPSRDAVIGEIFSSLKPNGWLALEELDASPAIRHSGDLYSRVWALLNERGASIGVDLLLGTRLERYIEDANFRLVRQQATPLNVQGGTQLAHLWRLTWLRAANFLVGPNLLSQQEFDEAVAQLGDQTVHLPSPVFVTALAQRM
jgi:ubiquinone/menaquinone biosynthesis C-methylase UbiE